MNIQINIYGSPWQSNTAEDALAFYNQAVAQSHTIKRVFFYFDGVYHGLANQSPSSDEFSVLDAWQKMKHNGVELLLCVAASLNRGVTNEQETKRSGKTESIASELFEVTGLGQWASGFHDCEKVVTFK